MSALDIQPHSARITHRVVLGLSALAAAAFLGGVVHQLAPDPSLFPDSAVAAYDYGGPPQAAPAPALQAAVEPTARPSSPATAEADEKDATPPIEQAQAAEPAPVVDVTAAIPDQPSPPAQAPGPASGPDPDAAPPT
ncbi:hypothetical protein [Phenylobacterium sp.]|jgi:hypothetical protein|uniref:hypothetical protein n=1 Tax=Phenylobacterium sp. TaxID=1871053 RepID=UPI002F3F766E